MQLLTIGEESSPRMLKEISMGLVDPGHSSTLLVDLLSGIPGDRVLDISISSSVPPVTFDEEPTNFNETLRTITIPTLLPFVVTHDIAYRVPHTAPIPLLAQSAYGEDFFDKIGEAVVNLSLATDGPRDIDVEAIALNEHVSSGVKS